jgi:hypothetical protein
MQNESWPRLLGRLVLALLAAGSAIAGSVFAFALALRSLGFETVWDAILPWPTDTLDAVAVYTGSGAFLLVALSLKLLRKAK